MKSQKNVIFSLLFISLLFTSGCVLLRLIQLKVQLNEFEKNIRVETGKGLTFTFLNPVLLDRDVLLLGKRPPTMIIPHGREEIWRYVFNKVYKKPVHEPHRSVVPLDLFFREHLLFKAAMPRQFMEDLPRVFIVESLKELGRAEIRPNERLVMGAFSNPDPLEKAPLLKRKDLLELLGQPYHTRTNAAKLEMVYIYRLKKADSDKKKKTGSLWLRFTFPKGARLISGAEARFAGIKITMTYPPP